MSDYRHWVRLTRQLRAKMRGRADYCVFCRKPLDLDSLVFSKLCRESGVRTRKYYCSKCAGEVLFEYG